MRRGQRLAEAKHQSIFNDVHRMSKKEKPQESPSNECLFGVFDILGFKALCKNNTDEHVIKLLETLELLDTDLSQQIVKRIAKGDKIEAHLRDKLKWMIFSDTICIAVSLPSEPHKYLLAEVLL